MYDDLTQSRAETAAAYERAARVVEKERAVWDAGYNTTTSGYAVCEATAKIREEIRALATSDQTAALDAVKAEARAQTDKAWETCFAATNRGMIAERKLAKAVEALRTLERAGGMFTDKPVLASNSDMIRAVNGIRTATFLARAVLAEIEKGDA